jgi:hypothetical protein
MLKYSLDTNICGYNITPEEYHKAANFMDIISCVPQLCFYPPMTFVRGGDLHRVLLSPSILSEMFSARRGKQAPDRIADHES